MMLDNQESLFVGHGTAANLPGNRLRGENLPHFPIGADVCDCALLIDDYKIAIVDAERVDADDFMVAVKNGGFSSGKNGKRGEAIAILLFGECDDVHVLGLYICGAMDTRRQTRSTGVGFVIIAITWSVLSNNYKSLLHRNKRQVFHCYQSIHKPNSSRNSHSDLGNCHSIETHFHIE